MRYEPMGSAFFERNRMKLVRLMPGHSMVVLHARDRLIRSGGQYYPYRQDPDFFYLTGIEQEKCILLVQKGNNGQEDESVLFIPKPDEASFIWEGPGLSPGEAAGISGIRTVHRLDDFDHFFTRAVPNAQTLLLKTVEPAGDAVYNGYAGERFAEKVRRNYPGLKCEGVAPFMEQSRMVKEAEEIRMITRACRTDAEAFMRALPYVRPGVREYEIEAEITREFIRSGASGHAYQPIIASGSNACVLHYTKNDKVLKNGELVLMDFGAEYGNYASDCSRTVPVNGRFTPRQKQLYRSVLKVFHHAKAHMVPGSSLISINREVCRLWEQEHLALGLYSRTEASSQKVPPQQYQERPLVRKYFPHGIGHFIGLDVHDAGDKETELQPGMVLTCEPGVYIPEEGVGIRLENDILVTKDGPVDLMAGIPLEPEEIEEQMKRRES